MSEATGKVAESGRVRHRIIWALLAVSLLMALGLGARLNEAADATLDFRMRVRRDINRLLHTLPTEVTSDICLLGIDQKTHDRFGKSGTWFSREPYLHQVAFFTEHLHPSVMAYDLIFHTSAGLLRRESDDEVDLDALAAELKGASADGGGVVPLQALAALSRYAGSMGDLYLAHRLADLKETANIPTVLGASFRGGQGEPDDTAVEAWRQADISGDDASGDEQAGAAIPYLHDIAVPQEDVLGDEIDQRYRFARNAVLPAPELRDYSRLGLLNVPRDEDSVARRVPMVLGFAYSNAIRGTVEHAFVPSFSLLTCLLHLGVEFPLKPGVLTVRFGDQIVIQTPERGKLVIPIDDDGALQVNYLAGLEAFDSVSFYGASYPAMSMSADEQARVANGLRRWFDGRIVMVGVTVTGEDVGATPVSGNVPLVYVHMMAASNILSQRFLAFPSTIHLVILYAALTLILGLGLARLGAARLAVGALLLLLTYLGFAQVLFWALDVVLPVITPALYIIQGAFVLLSYLFLTEERARKRVRLMFSTMVSDRVLHYLEVNPDSFSLKGTNVDATVMFSDVEGFTRISEGLAPERVTRLVNQYLTPITNSILRYDGYVDKYIGDGVMAVWGAPFPDAKHSIKACESALEQQELLRVLNVDIEKEYGFRLRVRMGLNAGTVTAGNMGSERKFQYTVMGDIVNFASRLEPVNKDFGTTILISEAVHQAVKPVMVTRLVTRLKVVGKVHSLGVYELVGRQGTVPESTLAGLRDYEAAWQAYARRDWAEACRLLDFLLGRQPDGVARWLLSQLELDRNRLLSADWAGEYERVAKH